MTGVTHNLVEQRLNQHTWHQIDWGDITADGGWASYQVFLGERFCSARTLWVHGNSSCGPSQGAVHALACTSDSVCLLFVLLL
jgi:hypothetical protein